MSLKTTQSPTSRWTAGGLALAISVSNFDLSVGSVIPTSCGELVPPARTTKSSSGPSSGRMSRLKSTPELWSERAELIAATSLS